MKALQGFQPKAFLIDHGEKLGLGLFAILAVLALCFTAWKPTDKQPAELLTKVQSTESRILQQQWPAAKQAQFQTVDYTDRAGTLLRSVNVGQYEFSTPLYWPLYRRRELAREPELVAVEYLEAKAGLVSLKVESEEASMLADSMTGETSPLDQPAENEGDFAVRSGNGGGGGFVGGPLAGGPAGHNGPPTGLGGGPTPGANRPAGHGGPGLNPAAMAGQFAAAGANGMSGMMMGGAGSGEARGQRFVAVRGVYPLRQQHERLQKALSLDSVTDAANLLEILDFTLERQAAVAAADPWTGEWETLKLDTVLEILNESPGFDVDAVDPMVTDPAITMPLPLRNIGFWGDYATHPRIKNFELSPQAIERRARLEALLIEEFDKAQLQETEVAERRGFSGVQRDIRTMSSQLFSSPSAKDSMQTMQRAFSADPAMRMPGAPNRQQQQELQLGLTAAGQLLLFRHFDFDVQPGVAYRYRVKLKLRNPNYGRAPEQAVDRSVVEGIDRETPWSNISNPAVVPDTTSYFLAGVLRDPVRQSKEARKPIAEMNYFEWEAKFGTWLNTTLELASVGNFIMGKKVIKHLDPARLEFMTDDEKTPSVVGTEDVLVDALGEIELSIDDHPQLGLKPEKNRRTVALALQPLALVVDQTGDLQLYTPDRNDEQERKLKAQYKGEQDAHAFINERPEAGSALDGAFPGSPASGMEAFMQQFTQPKGNTSRKRTDKKKGPGGAGPAAHGASAGGPAAHGAPPAGSGNRGSGSR